jgi:hypothetical protein
LDRTISSNQNTSNSLLRMARGSDQRISMDDTNSHRELQFTSLSSKLKIKDDLICECLHICNQNFDKRKPYHSVQVSEDNWMVWNFYQKKIPMDENIEGMVPKFLNVYNVCLKQFLDFFFFFGGADFVFLDFLYPIFLNPTLRP